MFDEQFKVACPMCHWKNDHRDEAMFKTVYNHTCGKHSYCSDCVQDVIEVAMQGKEHFPPRCPCKGPGNKQKNIIELKVVEEKLGPLWKEEEREKMLTIYNKLSGEKDKLLLIPVIAPPGLW